MDPALQPKQYPLKKRQYSDSPGWDTTYFQGSECEFLREYTDNGLCPVLIGDVLCGSDLVHLGKQCSFRIIGKLGRGSYSTVWLGRETASDEFLALKILRLEYSTLDNAEMNILRQLGKLEVAFFHTHAPTQDKFLCLGLKPLGCTLRERFNSEVDAPGDIPSLFILVRTLFMKVLAFHQMGISHGGVLPEAFTDEALAKTFQFDQKSHVILKNVSNLDAPPPRPGNLPEYIILRYGTPLKTNTQDMSLVDIIDFGKGFLTPSKSNVLGTESYSAPELERSANTATAKSDLWSLGCVLAYIPTYEHLFDMKSDLAHYLAANHEAQLSYIKSRLSMSYLKDEPEYCHSFARLIHCLVRPDPNARDPEAAKRILESLETWSPTHSRKWDLFASLSTNPTAKPNRKDPIIGPSASKQQISQIVRQPNYVKYDELTAKPATPGVTFRTWMWPTSTMLTVSAKSSGLKELIIICINGAASSGLWMFVHSEFRKVRAHTLLRNKDAPVPGAYRKRGV
ncbi:serine/threonine protein kinase [Blastomyces percursus]|uniref:Serine/threonine protein kinase n=1 Tax=Blastomyces percursus TaxID=1658174 RepID=A0A1J9Q044_9EURO|nr:serine/threonine protein kinase [Blastomyces percursus]